MRVPQHVKPRPGCVVPRRLLPVQTLARVVETTERHFKAAGRRSGLPLPPGPIEDRDYFRLWPKVSTPPPDKGFVSLQQ